MKKAIFYIGFALLISACGSDKKESTKTSEQETVSKNETPQSKWKYEENTNAMDDSKTYFAATKANEVMEFKFPYEGGVTTKLYLRNMSKQNDVFFVISQGQFLSNVLGNKSILVRFDKKKAKKYSYSLPSDGSSNTAFITQTANFIKELKQAKKLTIQCDFFNEGSRTLTFDVTGLEWKH